jgi:8-oxo-dGTP pyrophosphatase MutT (NUDIX family)
MIEAAGGVVLRQDGDGPQVLLVHRVRHDDWSLPKGKLDPGETAAAAAVREVWEETGVRAELGPELPSVHYLVAGEPKRVRWFHMSATDGDPHERTPDKEVDMARWVPVEEAAELLTYDHDRQLLAHVLGTGR